LSCQTPNLLITSCSVSAITLETNIASQKLIEKLGLTYQKMIKLPDDDDIMMYYEATL